MLFVREGDGNRRAGVVGELNLCPVRRFFLPAGLGFRFDDDADLAIVAEIFIERLEGEAVAIFEGEDQAGGA